jgi:ABC-2 type transport system permease protein
VRPDVSYVIPVRHIIIVIRGIVLKGVGADALRTELWAMSIIGAITVTLAATSFKKRLD